MIELTEHEAFGEDVALELELATLRERGARIALDDAGAGYAGLQQLIRLRPDIVKVDRSLVAGIHADVPKRALLEALARFAGTTGAAVCAEGVEELAELRALTGLDVTYAQGYALARPAPAWPAIPAAVAAEVAAAGDHGMRAAGASEAASLGEVTEVLARARDDPGAQAARSTALRACSAPTRRRSRASTATPAASSRSATTTGRRRRALAAGGLPDHRPRGGAAGDRPGDRRRPGRRPRRARGARDRRHVAPCC